MRRTGYQSATTFVGRSKLTGDYRSRAREQLSSLVNFSSMRTHRRSLHKFLDIFHTRNMVKRPGLGKRKRVTLPPVEASEEPEQPEQPDELPTQTQGIQPLRPPSQTTQMTWKRQPKTASPRGDSRRRGW